MLRSFYCATLLNQEFRSSLRHRIATPLLLVIALVPPTEKKLFAENASHQDAPNILFILIDDKYEETVEDASIPARTAEFMANSAFFKFMTSQ